MITVTLTVQQSLKAGSTKVDMKVNQSGPTETEQRLASEMIAAMEDTANKFSVQHGGQPARDNTARRSFPYPPSN